MEFQVIIFLYFPMWKKRKKGIFFSNNLIAKIRPAKGHGVFYYFLTNTEQGPLNGKKIKQIILTE